MPIEEGNLNCLMMFPSDVPQVALTLPSYHHAFRTPSYEVCGLDYTFILLKDVIIIVSERLSLT